MRLMDWAPQKWRAQFDLEEAKRQAELDGKEAEAVQLRQEIRTAEKTQLEFDMSQKMQQTVSQNAQATALQAAANELEANFPVFDQNSAEYNADYTQEVIDLRDAFIVQGFDAVDALSKAARFVIKDHGLAEEAPQESTLTQAAAPMQDEVSKKRAEVNKKLKAAKETHKTKIETVILVCHYELMPA